MGMWLGIASGMGQRQHEEALQDVAQNSMMAKQLHEMYLKLAQRPDMRPEGVQRAHQLAIQALTVDPRKPNAAKQLEKLAQWDMTVEMPSGTQTPTPGAPSEPAGQMQTAAPPPEYQVGVPAQTTTTPTPAMPSAPPFMAPTTEPQQKSAMYDRNELQMMDLSQKAQLGELQNQLAIEREVETKRRTLPYEIELALSKVKPTNVPGTTPGSALGDLETDTAGNPIDPELNYHVARMGTRNVSATVAAEGISWRTDWIRDVDSDTGFSHIFYNKAGKIVRVAQNVLPPSGYLEKEMETYRLVPQADGTVEAQKYTTKVRPVLGGTGTPSPRPSGVAPPQKGAGGEAQPSAAGRGPVVGSRIPQRVALAAELALDADNRYYIMMRNTDKPTPQGDVALLFNHIGMTLGAQKGARITDAEIRKAMNTRSLPEDLMAKLEAWGVWGYITQDKQLPPGAFLTPNQRKNMLTLAQEMREMIWWKNSNVRDFFGYQGRDVIPNPVLPPVQSMESMSGGVGGTPPPTMPGTKPRPKFRKNPDGTYTVE